MQGILLHLPSAALYVTLWLTCWQFGKRQTEARLAIALILCLALVFHALALSSDLFEAHELHFGLSNALSLTLWLAMAFYAVESTLTPLNGLLIIASPVAAIAAMFPVLLGGHPLSIPLTGWAFRLHIVVAMIAYSLFTLAAFHAILMLTLEKSLHTGKLPGALGRLPPLLTLERILFKLVGSAFVLLTATIVSGAFFSEVVFGKPFSFTHKSVFSILAWAVFGMLIAGRFFWGWRGKTALRWTVSGLVLMLLAYMGYRFVLEFVLGRSY